MCSNQLNQSIENRVARIGAISPALFDIRISP